MSISTMDRVIIYGASKDVVERTIDEICNGLSSEYDTPEAIRTCFTITVWEFDTTCTAKLETGYNTKFTKALYDVLNTMQTPTAERAICAQTAVTEWDEAFHIAGMEPEWDRWNAQAVVDWLITRIHA